LHKV